MFASWPSPVYHERAPSNLWHHVIGWSAPINVPQLRMNGCGWKLYELSSSVCSTCTVLRGLAWKLYHSSERSQRAGMSSVVGWSPSLTIVAWKHERVLLTRFGSPGKLPRHPGEPPRPPGWLAKRAWLPSSSPYHADSLQQSDAAWIP